MGAIFSYRVARKALAAGIVPHTLGADIHGYNTEVPAPAGTPAQHYDDENHPFRGQARFSLTQAMSSMLTLSIFRGRGADGDVAPGTDRLVEESAHLASLRR